MSEELKNDQISDVVIQQLKRTRPWILLFSILGFLFFASSLFATIASFLTEQGYIERELGFGSDLPSFSFIHNRAYISLGLGLIGAVLHFIIVNYLFRYFRGINKVIKTRKHVDLENAISAQASFWKTLGLFVIFNLLLLCIAFGYYFFYRYVIN